MFKVKKNPDYFYKNFNYKYVLVIVVSVVFNYGPQWLGCDNDKCVTTDSKHHSFYIVCIIILL